MQNPNIQPMISSFPDHGDNNKELRRRVLQRLPDASNAELNFDENLPRFSDMTLEQAKESVKDAFFNVCEVFFARNKDNVPESLMKAFVKAVLEKYYFFTSLDIELAFSKMESEGNGYIPMQINNFLKPLTRWLHRKKIILAEKQQFEVQLKYENEVEMQKQKFYQEAVQIYKSSIQAEQWLGDPYQASVLLEKIIDRLTPAEQEDLERRAKVQKLSIDETVNASKIANPEKAISHFDSLFLTEERIFNQLVLSRVIEKEVDKSKLSLQT